MEKVQIISFVTNISIDDIISKKRNSDIVEARQLCMYFLRKQGVTFKKCGEILKRNHSTIIHGYNRINNFIYIKDKRICYLIEKIQNYTQPFVYEI